MMTLIPAFPITSTTRSIHAYSNGRPPAPTGSRSTRPCARRLGPPSSSSRCPGPAARRAHTRGSTPRRTAPPSASPLSFASPASGLPCLRRTLRKCNAEPRSAPDMPLSAAYRYGSAAPARHEFLQRRSLCRASRPPLSIPRGNSHETSRSESNAAGWPIVKIVFFNGSRRPLQ